MRFLRFDCRDNRPDSVFFEEGAKRIGVTSLVARQPGIRGDKLTQVSATTQSSAFRGGSTHIYFSDRLWQRVSPAPCCFIPPLAQRWAFTCCQVAQAYRKAARWLALIGKGPRRSNENTPKVPRNSAATKHPSPWVIGKLLRLVRAKYRPCTMSGRPVPVNAHRIVA